MLTGLGLLLTLCPGPAVMHAQEARNPFNVPEQRVNRYNYGRAIRIMSLKGIVRTEGFKGCIVQVGDMETLSILKQGERISLDHEGLQHLFTVSEIREKSVVLTNKEGQTYEVPIQ
jgi:hypothetical protein